MKVIEIVGDKKKIEDFLQGQITSNIDSISSDFFNLSSICNQKGFVMADFFIGVHSEKYKIIINSALIDVFIDELSPYAKFFGVSFKETKNYVSASIDSPNNKTGEFLSNNEFALSIKIDEIKGVNNTITLDDWTFANMVLGNMHLSINDVGKYRPLEINYDKLRVCFDKGCFRGQEIIARMKYLGIDRRKFLTLISNKKINPEKKLRIIGSEHKYKDFYVYFCSINNDFFKSYKEDNPDIVFV